LRLSALPTFFLLAACASAPADFAQTGAPDPSNPGVIAALKVVAAQAKLQAPWEKSPPIEAAPVSSVHWLICVRSAATDEAKRHTVSAFFKGNDFVSSRLSAIIEHCAAQEFTPLQ
jgi:hypothetical protein